MARKLADVEADLDDLQAAVDEAVDILEAANVLTSSREDLAQALLDALDALSEEGGEEDDTDDSED